MAAGEPVRVLERMETAPGDTAFIAAEEEHWQGATDDSDFFHIFPTTPDSTTLLFDQGPPGPGWLSGSGIAAFGPFRSRSSTRFSIPDAPRASSLDNDTDRVWAQR